jgi:hypothetical protein
MDDRLTPQHENEMIEDALHSYPASSMPRSITLDVMSRIQVNQRPALLTWSDFGLSLVISTCIGALWFASQNLPPILLAKIRVQSILLYQDILVNARWLVPTVLFGLAALLAALAIPTLLKMTIDHRR